MLRSTFLVLSLASIVFLAGCDADKGTGVTTTGAAPNPATVAGAVPTDAEAAAFAEEFVQIVGRSDANGMNRMIDWELLLNTATANVDVPEKSRQEFIQGALQSITSNSYAQQVAKAIMEGGALSLIRIHDVDGEKRALFRMTHPDTGLNYHDFVLAKVDGENVRAVDIYVFVSSEKMSATMRRLYLTAAAGLNRSLIEKLRGVENDFVKHSEKFQSMSQNLQNGNHQAVINLYDSLPASLKKEKVTMLMRLQAASNLGDDLYIQTINDFRQAHPNDPTLDLISTDRYILAEEFDEALGCIDRLDDIVEDPYLNALRSQLLVAKGDLAAARKAAEQAVNDLPEFVDAYWAMIAVTLEERDFDETVRWMTEMEKKFQLAWSDLTTLPEYAEFTKSAAYRRWLQTQQ
jgi:tetratricopeptide (TPR) repeat protein